MHSCADVKMLTTVFTLGHSRHSEAHFLSLLRAHGVEQLADVRSHPRSKWAPQFDAASLAQLLAAHGVHYVSLGQQLGGRPVGRQFYRSDDSVDYALRSNAADFVEGISQLVSIAQHPTVILCAEEDPSHCHRRRLVAPALVARGVRVAHVRGDGRVEAELPPAPVQLGLF